jgi:NAD(P)-dependent dehydrogenase (short-subunit alcohol dehydrogenase family)
MTTDTTISYGLRGRAIAITGGASGIGEATAKLAAEQGARVVLLDQSEAQLQVTAQQLRALGADVMSQVLDVRDAAACESSVQAIESSFGPIDALVACAGISRSEPAEQMSLTNWDAVIHTNLSGIFHTVQPVGRRMLDRGRGAIVTVSSIDGFGGHAGRANYTASKHAIIGLTRSLAIEWSRRGVRVNAVAPGVVDTPLLRKNIPADHVEHAMVDRVPMARLSQAREQAHAILFLLSDGASYISGTTMVVDGGISAGAFTRWNGADLGSNALLEQGRYGLPPSQT